MGKTRLEDIYRGFSCPQESLDEKALELIVAGYARELTARFVDRYRRLLDGRGHGLTAVFQAWIRAAQGSEIGWDHSFGRIQMALMSDSPSSVAAKTAALGLRLLTITKYSDISRTFCYALVHGQSSRGQAGL